MAVDSSSIKHMSLRELLEEGFVQEANRQFFHPRGLALCVGVNRRGRATELTVWDYREDAEGITFGEGVMTREKAEKVEAELDRHAPRRLELFAGSVIQPLPPNAEVKDDEHD